jgi:DNA (cytosine-5)-methyltransferase 1
MSNLSIAGNLRLLQEPDSNTGDLIGIQLMINNNKFSVISLFSGAGGFDWGFHKTNRFYTYLACEKLTEPSATLAHNLNLEIIAAEEFTSVNGTPLLIQGDIQLVDFSQAEFHPDVLIGGPPCQDFSLTISKVGDGRPGLNGGRGKLYVEFVRAIMFFQPKIFVFENVPGLNSANEGVAITTILSDLQNLESKRKEVIQTDNRDKVPSTEIKDYLILFKKIVEAPKIGIAQTRERLIIIGIRCDLFEALSKEQQIEIIEQLNSTMSGENSLLARFPMTCMEVFEGRTLLELQAKYKEVMLAYEDLVNDTRVPKAAEWREQVWNKLDLDDIRHDYFLVNQIEETPQNLIDFELAMELHNKILEEQGWLGTPVHTLPDRDDSTKKPRESKGVKERMKMIPPDKNYEFVDDSPWKVKGHDISFIYRRAAPLKPAWTVMAHGGGGTYGYHYERDKAMLTLRERARIQTFTDDFEFKAKKVREQIGEAVPPLMAKRIAEQIINILEVVTENAQV